VLVERLPQDSAGPLARITVPGSADADRQAQRRAAAITVRRTDRPAFSARTVSCSPFRVPVARLEAARAACTAASSDSR
jgi:hypothetical protein